jgi:hypothetical protein
MIVTCTVQLDATSGWGMTADEAAAAVLLAVGGDPAKDTCILNVAVPSATAGVEPGTQQPAA